MSKKKEEEVNVIDKIFAPELQKEKEKSIAENISMIIAEWLDPKHVKYKTRLGSNQIVAMSIFQSLADTYNIKTLKRFLNEYRIAKLSEGGQSSEELRDILMARMPEVEMGKLEKLTQYLE